METFVGIYSTQRDKKITLEFVHFRTRKRMYLWYDVRSFVSVSEHWIPHLEHYYKIHADEFDTKPKYVFVGTKSDLLHEEWRETVSDERVREMMKDFGTHIENIGYFKCSAKSGNGVRDIFESVREAMVTGE